MIYWIIAISLVGIFLMLYRKEWIPFVIIATLPLERIPSFDSHGVTIRVSLIIIPVAFLICLFDIIKNKRIVRLPKFLWWLVIYLIIIGLSVFVATDKARALSVIMFLVFAMVAGLVVSQVANKKNFEKMAQFLLLISVLVALFALYQFIGDSFGLSSYITGLKPMYTKAVFGFPRAQSTFLEPLYLANFLLIPISILIVAWIKGWRLFSGIWLNVFLILMWLVFVLTISRGAYLALGVEILFIGIIFIKSLKWKTVGVLALDGLLVLLFAYGLIILPGYLAKRFIGENNQISTQNTIRNFTTHAVDTKDTSSNDRLSTYNIALNQWKSSPIFGVGIGNYGVIANRDNPKIVKTQIVNNEPLEILAETGLAGFLAIFGFFVGLVLLVKRKYYIYKNTSEGWLMAAFGICLAGVLVQYQFFSTLYILHIWFLFGWIVGLGYNLTKEKA